MFFTKVGPFLGGSQGSVTCGPCRLSHMSQILRKLKFLLASA